MVELLGLPYSPWSEKARWALDARGISYRARTYAPLVGELELRRRLRRWTGPVSVPILITDREAIADSAAIARWADERGEGPRLFPAAHAAEIARWIERSERGLSAGRALALARLVADRAALAEMVPRRLRSVVGPLAPRLGGVGVRRTLRKYGADERSLAEHERILAEVLDELRSALAARGGGGGATLCGELSFADIAMTQVLTFIAPPPFGVRIGEASRGSFTDPTFSARYADLIRWRDALYAAHRPRVDGR